MLDWIKALAQTGFAAEEVESDELYMDFSLILPSEIRAILSAEANAGNPLPDSWPLASVKADVTLDEHELALA